MEASMSTKSVVLCPILKSLTLPELRYKNYNNPSKIIIFQTIAAQVKGPFSDALEESCRQEASARNKNQVGLLKMINYGTCYQSANFQEWDDILGSADLLKKTLRAGKGTEKPQDGQWVVIRVIDTLR